MKILAFDTETFLIQYPDNVNPKGVCFSYAIYNNNSADDRGLLSFYFDRETIKRRFLTALEDDTLIVGHNIAFDLWVMLREYPDLIETIWSKLERGQIKDTQIREKLYLISKTGRHDAKPTDLVGILKRRLSIDISADKEGDVWRYRYAELVSTKVKDYPKAARDYAIADAMYTLSVYMQQEKTKLPSGPGSINGENLQVAAAFAARMMTIEGMATDPTLVAELKDEYEAVYNASYEKLKEMSLIRESGTRNLQAIRDACERAGATQVTRTGALKTSRDILNDLEQTEEIKALKTFSDNQKAVTTFIPQLGFERIHPGFNPMVSTLRMSCTSSKYYKYHDYRGNKPGMLKQKRMNSVPSINFQQIPRNGRFRECFIADPETTFICADYANLELVCTAQTALNLFGSSEMAEVLNTGENLHDVLGREIYNRSERTEITLDEYKRLLAKKDDKAKYYRQAAKPINLGCPGGQGAATIMRTANSVYGIPLTLDQAEELKRLAFDRYPEFTKFFGDTTKGVGGWLPRQKTGFMYIKNKDTGEMEKTTKYSCEIAGIYFNNKTYSAIANGVNMQIPAALGVKIALVRLARECTDGSLKSPLYGCKLKAAVHDEFLLQCSDNKVAACQDRMAKVMLESMQKITPNLRVACESSVSERWGKDFDNSKNYYLPPIKEV